jgi:hypothetical protein
MLTLRERALAWDLNVVEISRTAITKYAINGVLLHLRDLYTQNS